MPYGAGLATLFIGIVVLSKRSKEKWSVEDHLLSAGPLLVAIAMAVFGADHLIAAAFVANMVPAWMPWHLFWAYVVGFALIAAALSLATRIQWRLSSWLLGVMILLFVAMIHIPSCFARPFDPTRLTIVFRDTLLSLCLLAFAISPQREQAPGGSASRDFEGLRRNLVTIGRWIVALVVAAFAVDHFLYPAAAPGIPQENPAVVMMLPAWLPLHALWSYLVGAVFMCCALALASGRRARMGATVLGATALLLAVAFYLPLTISRGSDIANGLNYLAIHLALAGCAFLLAQALPALEAREPEGVTRQVAYSAFPTRP